MEKEEGGGVCRQARNLSTSALVTASFFSRSIAWRRRAWEAPRRQAYFDNSMDSGTAVKSELLSERRACIFLMGSNVILKRNGSSMPLVPSLSSMVLVIGSSWTPEPHILAEAQYA